ncbi:MAG: hypothetical protein WB586_01935 [Chthoniobacterales bacterium]
MQVDGVTTRRSIIYGSKGLVKIASSKGKRLQYLGDVLLSTFLPPVTVEGEDWLRAFRRGMI